MLFSIRITNYQNNSMLNICDPHLLGKKIVDDKMVGKETVSLSISLGIGSSQGVKEINGVPFLLIFKM
jgi:hypothetical protein